MTHADLTLYQRPELLRDDLRESRAQLEAVIDAKSDILAYPRGSWSFAVIAAAKELGYVAGCTCMEGRNTSRTNPFLLRRVEIHDRDVGWRLTLKLRFGRDLLRWPPRRPASLAIAARWLRFARTRPAAGR